MRRAPAPRRSLRGAFDPFRTVIAVVMVAALVMTLSWLQGRYDASDHRKAKELVQNYKGEQASLMTLIQQSHPGLEAHEISWSSEITSGCLGIVRVTAHLPKTQEAPGEAYAFDVRLTGPSIHPTDPRTVDIMKGLGAVRTATVP